jgi:SAM-dependent methyltransferase
MNDMFTQDKIEIIPCQTLIDSLSLKLEIEQTANYLGISYGWHYLLDFVWGANQLQKITNGQKILDAGASLGVMQWWLAKQGATVISVDLEDRKRIDPKLKAWCPIQGLRPSDYDDFVFNDFLPSKNPRKWHKYPSKLSYAVITQLRKLAKHPNKKIGKVYFYQQNIADMIDLEDNSIDAIISISALEHNSLTDLQKCVKELTRVCKVGGAIIATVGAAKETDWYHEPSQGWCFSEKTLVEIFNLEEGYTSNYEKYYQLMCELRNNSELKAKIPSEYFQSGNNGLPWGIWDPKYLPVGIVKVKR